MERPNWIVWVVATLIVCAMVGCLVLVFLLAQDAEEVPEKPSEGAKNSRKEPSRLTVAAPITRRLPVSGAKGFYIVINPDGSSYMEGPEGKKTSLTGALPKASGAPDTLVDKVVGRMADLPVKAEVGQLVVCDNGVVDVPKNAVITYIGEDKVVTHNSDGSSTVYFVDGRVVQRDRTERRPTDAPARKP
jgi:hypothetical protein